MKRSESPKKQPVPFGINGLREELLPSSPAGSNAASYLNGYPAITMTLKTAGGLPPRGQDMNQILYELSSLSRWASSGAINSFDPNFNTGVAGYPKGSQILGDDGTIYISTIDDNTNNPNSSTIGWLSLFSYLGLGSAAKANSGDFISSSGGNYQAILRMNGIETLPTESAAANLSSLYSAPSPIPANVIVSGGISNWYTYQAMWGLKRDASNGIQGWAVQINGADKFLVDASGNAYANSQKLATEAYAKNYADANFVPTARKVNNKRLDSDITLSAADVGAMSSQGGNYQATIRMAGVEVLPTESSALNISALYSAPTPINPGSVASGVVNNWYNNQAIYGLIRNASNGINGWGVTINGSTLFLVSPTGDCYANNNKLATESFVTNGLNGKQDKNQTLTDLSGKTPAQINSYLGLGTAASKNIGGGPGQVPDMSLFPLVGGANGYVKLPNGFIFQWGSANAGSGSASIAFPMQFPGGCVGVEITGTSARASNDVSAVNIIAGETNAGGFGVNGYSIKPGGQVNPQGIGFNYCAWGY